MNKIPLTYVAFLFPLLAIGQNLPTGKLILTAKPSDIDGYELTVTLVNKTNHTIYMPPFGAGTTIAKGYVKHGKSYRQVSLRPSRMQIHPVGEKITDFKALAPGAKDAFTIFLNRRDIEGSGYPTKFDLTWSQNLKFSDGTHQAFRLRANTAFVRG
jgi:hypothetical protein